MDSVYAEEMFYNEDYTRSVVLIKLDFAYFHHHHEHPLQAALLRSLQWVSDRYVSLQEIICYGRLRGYGETP